MPVWIYRILVSFYLVAFFATGTLAEDIDDSPEVVSLYSRGKRLLREGDWYGAANAFKELEGRFSHSKNIDLFIFQRAKAKYYLGELSEAIAAFNYYIARFPNSISIPYAYFFLGNALYLNGDVNRAVKSYLKSYRLAKSKRLNQLLASSLMEAFKNAASIKLGAADFELLPDEKKCVLIKPLADIHVKRGELDRANRLLSICGEKFDVSANQDISSHLAKKQLEVALVVPLSGELHSFGEEIYNGAVIAADFYRKEIGKEVRLVPYDSRGDPVEAARIIGELAGSLTTDVVVGPLTSEGAAVASAALSCTSLPMIAPAATQAGLTRLSTASFQLSPNIELEGITLAEYAFNQVMADSVAIISSTANKHLRTVRTFSEHFKKLGGTVVAVEYYRARDKDFGAYIRDIKAMLLGQPADSTFFVNEEGDTLDFDIVPAYIDCLFIPGDPGQLRQLLPQIRFYNLNGNYLGSDGWGNPEVYKLGDDITKGAVFSSPFLEGGTSREYQKLAAAYDSRYGDRPSRLAALGYDAVRLVTQTVALGGVSRDKILEKLKNVTGYDGASGKISFGVHRENIEMPLYRIESEQAVLLSQGESAVEHFEESGE